jgi:hypothetical protein
MATGGNFPGPPVIWAASCHCGRYQARLASRTALRPRACGCSFCRRHGARTVSDPDGLAAFKPGCPHVYQFGSGMTDFLVCPVCGVYIGAAMTIGDDRFATINLNCIVDVPEIPDAVPVSYDGETIAMKIARRRTNWTPVVDWQQLCE